MRQSSLRCLLEFGGSMLAYLVLLIVSLTFLRENPDSPWQISVTIAPVIPIVFAMLAVIRFVRHMDELRRHIHLEAIIIAYLATLILCFSYGFLENVGLPSFNTMWVGVAMICLWGIGQLLANRKYK